VTMARANRINVFMIKVNKLFFFFSLRNLKKKNKIENKFFMFLSSYSNTRASLGELEKAVETLA